MILYLGSRPGPRIGRAHTFLLHAACPLALPRGKRSGCYPTVCKTGMRPDPRRDEAATRLFFLFAPFAAKKKKGRL
jgi:hypothetical protein